MPGFESSWKVGWRRSPPAASYGQPLTAVTGVGAVTINEGGRVLTSFRTAAPNVEEPRWYAEQELIVVKSRSNHGPATVPLFNSRTGRDSVLYMTGDHTISIFQNRAFARRGGTAEYKMLVRTTDKPPAEEEVPATGAVPQKVIDDCLASPRKQVTDKEMKLIPSKRGETSFIIDVQVEGVPEPWRCYHDGIRCTGTEYQGEG